ncbi:alpha/beta fold hydrolase [Mesorhizobium sp. GbtcB19]|uniref:alpha/beta fold hydrolase n=1 Tax=Mesorhizobium sp. GbtcB19 TaxID=2824764 RepID=UPI001C300A61|nr:alpha/beta hydrolase [Mesorhizobium sp. GbtcB19]
MATLLRDGARLRITDTGAGRSVVFQHGLGGGEAQAAQTCPDGFRRITLECRGHGGSGLGERRPFSFEMFADDVIAAADQLGLDRFVAGGVSMGAAIALRLAYRYPRRVTGLILVRPAWTFSAAPQNMQPIAEVAELILEHGTDKGRRMFAQSETATRLYREAPDNLSSLLGYFDRPDASAFAQVLANIAGDGPGVGERDAAALDIPALVVGNAMDAVHPLSSAYTLAAAMPDAVFAEITPKARDSAKHFSDLHQHITSFLQTHSSLRSPIPS